MVVFVLLGIIVGFLAGVGLAYQLLQKRLGQQRREHLEQTRQAIEDLEKKQEARMQQAIGPIRTEYETQLAQSRNEIAQLQQSQDTRIAEIVQATRSQYEAELARSTQTLEEVIADYESRIQSLLNSANHPQPTSVEENSYEGRINEIVGTLQEQYETTLLPTDTPIPKIERNQAALEAILPEIPVMESSRLPKPQPTPVPDNSYEGRINEIVGTLQEQYETTLLPTDTPIPKIERNQAALEAVLPQVPVSESSLLPEIEIATSPEDSIANPDNLLIQEPAQTANLHPYELCQQILSWGETGQVRHLSALFNYARHRSPDVRQSVAIALGNLVIGNRLRGNSDRLIPIVAKLSQDAKPKVRQAAIITLGTIHSPQVVPYLQRALRDPVGYVGQSASIAIRRLRLTPTKPPITRRPNR